MRWFGWFRRTPHEWQPTGTKFNAGCGGPYDQDKAVAGRLAALHRQAERRRVEAGRVHKADVIRLDSRRKAGQ